ncbi:tRNA lysidine(34) synthetase TilS [Flavihumibacter sediminis]|nr:tRNA lysidine(34) synthetase TilS [Flavihumibacter sediminis]
MSKKDLAVAFKQFIEEHSLFTKHDRLLVGVSGGIDSVVLCHLLREGGYSFEIAHVNFLLREQESYRDEDFCRQLAQQLDLPIAVARYDTRDYAQEKKLSIQVAARELRYAFFNQLITERKGSDTEIKNLLTAHHADDNAETVLMNLFRGTGLAGLRGIPPSRGEIRRPLLFASRNDITEYASQKKVTWVEDSSNAESKYARNFVRNNIIPALREQYPTVVENINDSARHLHDVEEFYMAAMKRQLDKLVLKKDAEEQLPILKWKQLPGKSAILYEWLQPFGFSSGQMADLEGLADSQTGQYIDSPTHRLLRNRNWLVLTPLPTVASGIILLEGDEGEIQFRDGILQWKIQDYAGEPISDNTQEGWLDAADIRFPLLLRPWKAGDYFYPLGMRKKKKLARFFIDNKLSRNQKEKTWVIESSGRIIWVLAQRIDDRFRISASTKKILQFKFVPLTNTSI